MSQHSVIRIAVNGADGRMGRRILALVGEQSLVEVAATITRAGRPVDVADIDVIVDFSTPHGTEDAVLIARETGAALLVGTTGLSAQIHRQLGDLARSNAVMVASNTAPGVVVLTRLVELAARCLPDFDVDVVEHHHGGKRDAPSGTAKRIVEVLDAARDEPLEAGRIHALRGGEIPGDHRVFFSGPGELLEIGHRAVSRDVFAHGAIRAARWLAHRPPGHYTIDQVYDGGAGGPGG